MKTVIDTEAALELANIVRERAAEWLGRISDIGEQGAKLDSIMLTSHPEYDLKADMEKLLDLSVATIEQLRPAYEPESEAPSHV